MAARNRPSGPATLRETNRARPAAVTLPTASRKTISPSMPRTRPSAVAGSASRMAAARVAARTPSNASGRTPASTNITSRRARTGSRGTPRTALRFPSGKNLGSTFRHCCSAAKKISAVTTVPPTPMMPKTTRRASRGVNVPVTRGHTTPHVSPASIQPTAVTPAMVQGYARARRRSSECRSPPLASACSSGRICALTMRWPAPAIKTKAIAKNTSSPRLTAATLAAVSMKRK